MSDVAANPKDEQTHAIIGAAMEVHRHLGPGFLEAVYQEALALEFAARGIPFAPQVKLQVYYKGQLLQAYYQPDFLCYDSVIVELKAISALTNLEDAILLNYLKATPLERGLLLNFAAPSLEFKRGIFSNSRKQSKQSPPDVI